MKKEIYCNSHFCGLVTVKDEKNLIMINESDWEKIGNLMGWEFNLEKRRKK